MVVAVAAVLGSDATPLSVAARNITHNSPALACAVCFGDPESPLTKGALMGVYVLLGVVSFVLAGITATGVFWIQRSRRLARPSAATPLSVAANNTRMHCETTDPTNEEF